MLGNGGAIFNKLENKTETYFNGKVFEDILIYELKKDNIRLLKKLQLYTGNNMSMNDRLVLGRHQKSENLQGMPIEIGVVAIQRIMGMTDELMGKFKRLK